jgi:hypothetical protein
LPGGHARAANDERHEEIFVVSRVLSGIQAMLTLMETVVGGEEDVRVVELTRRRHGVDHVADEIFNR